MNTRKCLALLSIFGVVAIPLFAQTSNSSTETRENAVIELQKKERLDAERLGFRRLKQEIDRLRLNLSKQAAREEEQRRLLEQRVLQLLDENFEKFLQQPPTAKRANLQRERLIEEMNGELERLRRRVEQWDQDVRRRRDSRDLQQARQSKEVRTIRQEMDQLRESLQTQYQNSQVLQQSLEKIQKQLEGLQTRPSTASSKVFYQEAGQTHTNDGEIVVFHVSDNNPEPKAQIPETSYISGTVLTGVFAPENGVDVMIQANYLFDAPGNVFVNMSGCRMSATAAGNVGYRTPRVEITIQRITCVEGGQTVFRYPPSEEEVEGGIGYALGSDHRRGVEGELISAEAMRRLLAASTQAFSELSSAVSEVATATQSTGGDQPQVFSNVTPGQEDRFVAGRFGSGFLEEMLQIQTRLIEKSFDTVDLPGGTPVTVVLTQPIDISLLNLN